MSWMSEVEEGQGYEARGQEPSRELKESVHRPLVMTTGEGKGCVLTGVACVYMERGGDGENKAEMDPEGRHYGRDVLEGRGRL